MMELLHDHRQAHGCLQASLVFLVVHPSPACAPGLAHNTKHAMTKHLALFASLGRLTLSEHIFCSRGKERRRCLLYSFALLHGPKGM